MLCILRVWSLWTRMLSYLYLILWQHPHSTWLFWNFWSLDLNWNSTCLVNLKINKNTLIGHSDDLSSEAPVCVFCPLFYWATCLSLDLQYSLCILDKNSLSVVSIANIFSHSVAPFFILLMMSFGEEKFLILYNPIYHFIYGCCSLCLKKSLPSPKS